MKFPIIKVNHKYWKQLINLTHLRTTTIQLHKTLKIYKTIQKSTKK